MSTKDYSAELLKMEGVQIEKLDETEEEIILQISMERKMHVCKRCGEETDRVHDCAAVDVMLRFSDRLLQAYALKEAFYHFMDAPDRPTALRRLDFWLDACDRLELPEFKSCRKTLLNWKPYILNAFDFRLSNGFTEGCNNAIKTLKRVAFGFRNFRSFRARILLSLGPYPNI